MVVKTKKKHTSRHKYVKKKIGQNKLNKEKKIKENKQNETYSDDLEDLPNYSDSSEDSIYINREVEHLFNNIQENEEEEEENERDDYKKQIGNNMFIKNQRKQKERHINFITAAVTFNIPMGML